MRNDQATVNYLVYEDGHEYLGSAKVTMPSLSFITAAIQGSGLAGEIEAVLPHVQSMSMSMDFRTLTDDAARLTEHRIHQLDLRVAVQDEDSVSGTIINRAQKHVMRVLPKSLNPGTLTPASSADGSGEYAVRYWAAYNDGKKVLEIDPMNYILFINGVDYLADVRKALGK